MCPIAQTERRGGAWPVRGLLGGKDPTGRLEMAIRAAVSFAARARAFAESKNT